MHAECPQDPQQTDGQIQPVTTPTGSHQDGLYIVDYVMIVIGVVIIGYDHEWWKITFH